jgi:hypothetical protein
MLKAWDVHGNRLWLGRGGFLPFLPEMGNQQRGYYQRDIIAAISSEIAIPDYAT